MFTEKPYGILLRFPKGKSFVFVPHSFFACYKIWSEQKVSDLLFKFLVHDGKAEILKG